MEKKLAILLDPEKANLDSLPISESCHPDYIFVGGSTGGDTTAYAIPVTITPVGAVKKMKIVYSMTDNEAQITELPENEAANIG